MSKKADRPKEPHWLNQKDMAASCDVTIQTLARWGVKPVAKIGAENFYTVREVLDNRLAHQAESLTQSSLSTPADPDSIEYQRLRLTKEQADNMALKNEQARAKLVPIELMTLILSRIAGEWAGIIDAIPLNIKRKHPGLDTAIIDDIKWHCVKSQNAVARLDSVVDDVVTEYANSIRAE